MEKRPEQRPEQRPVESDGPKVKLDYMYTDSFGQVFGAHRSETLSLVEPSSREATRFDGSVETICGVFMLECPIAEAKSALVKIAELIKITQQIHDLDAQLKSASENLSRARARFQSGDDPDYDASNAVNDLQAQKIQQERLGKVLEEGLKEYKVD